ncbi:EamA family transporter [Streptomyces sp. J2-1]|uniref:EamA family transporter n=1 Tax=Streptomyces corallincola TaxID=2851888 RepID=UPI001C3883C9|nr:EamA family transporter [Streptomyces corallincola]MBV2353884.1 EamA family transporter [Streptomyces corallincola]
MSHPTPLPRRSTALVAPLLMLGQVASLQTGAAVAKLTYGTISPTALAGIRLGFAAVIMCALVRPKLRAVSRAQWGAALALGLTLAVMNLAYFQALDHLPIGVAATLELLGPLLLSAALSRSAAHLAAAVLALAGVLLLATPGASLPAVGVALGCLAAVCRATYVVLNRRLGRLFPDFGGLAIALACGACVLVPVSAFSGGGTVAARPWVLLPGLAVALLSSVIPYSLDMTLLRRIDARAFGVLLALSPAVGALIGYLALGERLTVRQLTAMALVVAAGAWTVRRQAGAGKGDEGVGKELRPGAEGDGSAPDAVPGPVAGQAPDPVAGHAVEESRAPGDRDG